MSAVSDGRQETGSGRTRGEQIRARTGAATPGPWRRYFSNAQKADHVRNADGTWVTQFAATEADAEFIAHARDDIEWLLAECDRLRGQNERANLALTKVKRYAEALRTYDVDTTEWFIARDILAAVADVDGQT